MHTSPAGRSDSDETKNVTDVATPVTARSPEASPDPPTLTMESPELYINRELSLLEFQKRVLEQTRTAKILSWSE